jgi:hypothetical protein
MHASVRLILLALLLIPWGVTAWLVLGSPVSDDLPGLPRIELAEPKQEEDPRLKQEEDPRLDPFVKTNFGLIKIGMTLEELEAIMGPAGPSYSSLIGREYYIWKDKGSWVSVFIKQNKVTDIGLRFVPDSN